MAKKCCIFNSRLQKDDPGCLNLNFFKVPKDEKTRKEWANNIKNYFKTDIEFKKCSYVCAKHFEAECFNYGGLCKVVRLKKGSCPTIFEEVEQIASIQKSPSDLLTDDEMDTSTKECT